MCGTCRAEGTGPAGPHNCHGGRPGRLVGGPGNALLGCGSDARPHRPHQPWPRGQRARSQAAGLRSTRGTCVCPPESRMLSSTGTCRTLHRRPAPLSGHNPMILEPPREFGCVVGGADTAGTDATKIAPHPRRLQQAARCQSAASRPRGRNRGSRARRLHGDPPWPSPTTSINTKKNVSRPRRLQHGARWSSAASRPRGRNRGSRPRHLQKVTPRAPPKTSTRRSRGAPGLPQARFSFAWMSRGGRVFLDTCRPPSPPEYVLTCTGKPTR